MKNKLFLSFVAASFAPVGRYDSEKKKSDRKQPNPLAQCSGLYTSVLSCLSPATADKILRFELRLAYLRSLDWSIAIGPIAKRQDILFHAGETSRGWAPTNLKVCFRVVHKD